MKKQFTYVRYFALPVLFIAAVLITGCSKKNNTPDNGQAGGGTSKIDSVAVTIGPAEGSTETGADPDDLIEGSTFPTTVAIAFSGTAATITPATTTGVTITQTGGDVVVNSTATGVMFTVSGTTANGSVKIYSDKKFALTLNNANIINLDGPAINIQSSKRAFIVLADGSTNTLADGPVYTPFGKEDMKATFFSEGQLIFSGTGSLSVTGNYKHAICSDDYVRVRTGSITVNKSISDGIHVNNAFIADGGTIKITSGSDGIEAEEGDIIINNGNLTINAVGKGLKTSYSGTDATILPYINFNGGTVAVTSTGDEGVSSNSVITINKGNITSNASDDGFNAQTAIYVNGGNVYAHSTANDAMDSNGTFSMNGGKLVAIGSAAPESSIDCNANVFKITGGTLIGIGGTTSAISATASTTHSVILGSGTAQLIHIEATDGTEALTFLAPAAFGTLVYAGDKLKANTTYNVYTGGSVSSGLNFNGLYNTGTYNKGTKSSTTFTTSSIVTQVGGTISTK